MRKIVLTNNTIEFIDKNLVVSKIYGKGSLFCKVSKDTVYFYNVNFHEEKEVFITSLPLIINDIEYDNMDDVMNQLTKFFNNVSSGGGSSPVLQLKTVNYDSNGNYSVHPDVGYDGLSNVDINIDIPTIEPVLEPLDLGFMVDYKEGMQTHQYLPSNFNADGFSEINIELIPTPPNLQNKTVNYDINGNHIIQADLGYDGIRNVNVNIDVPTPEPELQSKSVSFNSNGDYSVTSDPEYDGLSTVHVEVYIPPSGEPYLQPLNLDLLAYPGLPEHYQYEPGMYGADGFSEVHVDIQGAVPHLQNKNESYIENGTYHIDTDSGYDGINSVRVNIDVPQTSEPILDSYSASFNAQVEGVQHWHEEIYPGSGIDGWNSLDIYIEPFGDLLDEQAYFDIYENGSYELFPPMGVGFKNAYANVYIDPRVYEETIDIDSNGTFEFTPVSDMNGFSKIIINVNVV